jgi:DNA-binding transcriptional LysR family regulator
MDYNRVALFVRVVRAGSFTRAAAVVGLPKSSVSRGIAQLERDLGVRLLQRTTRKLTLTEAGQVYFDAVSGSVAGIDEADAAARERGAAPRGTVRVTAPPDSGTLAAALVRFVRKHPGIRIELTITSRFVDLVGEGIDLALRAGRLEDSSLVARRVGGTEIGFVAAPAYLRERGRPRTLADLSAHAFVLYRASGGRARLSLIGPDGEQSIEVVSSLVADDMPFCRSVVEAGGGVALLPVRGVVDALRAGRLERILPEWTAHGAGVYLVLPSARDVPARVALLRDFLADDLGRQLADIANDPAVRAQANPTPARRRDARRG